MPKPACLPAWPANSSVSAATVIGAKRARAEAAEGPYLLLRQIRQVHFVEDEQVRLNPEGFLKQRVAPRKWDVAKSRQKFLQSFASRLIYSVSLPRLHQLRRKWLLEGAVSGRAHTQLTFWELGPSPCASLPHSHGATETAPCSQEATGRAVALTWLLKWE